jgi:tetratricopeptide (TPR) repeat protein
MRAGRRLGTVLWAVLLLAVGSFHHPARGQESAEINALLSEGSTALETGDLATAEERFRSVLELSPLNLPAQMGISAVLEHRGDFVTALEHARIAEESAPEEPAVVYAVGRLLARLDANTEALESLERARALAPENPLPILLAAVILRDDGRVEEAAAMLQEAWDEGVRSEAIGTQLGSLYLTLDRRESALEVARRAQELHPDRGDLKMIEGLALVHNAERREEAIATLRRALELGVSRPGLAYLELANALIEEGEPEEAVGMLEEAQKLLPDSPEVYYRLGAARRLVGDPEGAREALRRFQELRGREDSAGARAKRLGTELNRALTLADENQLRESIEQLDQVLAADPDNARVLASKAKVLFSLRRAEEALKTVVRARELDLGRVEHHLLEGLFLLELGKAAEAEAPLRRAIDLDPHLSEPHELLAASLAKTNRPGDAAEHFREALDLGADSPALRLGYAAALESLGQLEESKEQMAAYRRLKEEE